MTDWITTPIEPLLRGVVDVEHTPHGLLPHRIKAAGRKHNGMAVERPAGVADAPTPFIDARALIGCRHRLHLDAAHPG
uniref:hypothetical protein n=1 Tax=Nocardia brasiliensis TaxID=37326 RepID=UPI002457BA3E